MLNIQNKKKVALVLSGGGVKAAAYHIGVCMALKEYGFEFVGGTKKTSKSETSKLESTTPEYKKIQLYVGSSAGAFISAALASGRSLEAIISAFQVGIGSDATYKVPKEERLKPISYRHIFKLNSKRVFNFIPKALFERSLVKGGLEASLKASFKLNGIFNTSGIERYTRQYLLEENNFSKLEAELYIISTQLNHSRKTVFGNLADHDEFSKDESIQKISYSTISEAVAASTALPPVFAPYPIIRPNGKEIYHYDGEIRDTLSTHVAADHGADLVISSYSMQPYHYVPEIGSLHKYGMPAILNQALYQVLEQKVAHHIKYQEQKKDVYAALKEICEEENLSNKLKTKILDTVKEELQLKENIDWLYISPIPQNYEMFFADHFSLNGDILEKIVRVGFKSALTSLKKAGLSKN